MPEFRPTQISDTHLTRRHQTDNFHRVSEYIDATKPDLVVNSGDLTFDAPTSPNDLAFAKTLHAALPVECRYLPGNHDVGDNPNSVGPAPSQPTTEADLKTYRATFGEDRWRFEAACWCFIGLNSRSVMSGRRARPMSIWTPCSASLQKARTAGVQERSQGRHATGRTKMARLPYIEADQVAPEYRDMLKRNTNLHKLLVNSPDMARAFNGVGSFIRFKSKLDPRLRELAILQVGWMEKSEYEFTHHVKIGREFGVTDADIEGLMAETEGKPSALEPLARAILKGARELVRGLAMSDATFAEIKQHLSNEHMTDLVLTIAFYCAVVRVLATMQIDNEPYYKEVLQQYPMPGVK
jgi:alkylhydroperoxidase family enzyme